MGVADGLARKGLAGGDDAAVGQQIAGVVEAHDAVAQKVPTLLRVAGDDSRRIPIRRVSRGAVRLVPAHRCASVAEIDVGVGRRRLVQQFRQDPRIAE